MQSKNTSAQTANVFGQRTSLGRESGPGRGTVDLEAWRTRQTVPMSTDFDCCKHGIIPSHLKSSQIPGVLRPSTRPES